MNRDGWGGAGWRAARERLFSLVVASSLWLATPGAYAQADPPAIEVPTPTNATGAADAGQAGSAAPPPREPIDLTWRPHAQVWFRPGGLLQARYTFNHRPEHQGEAENTSRFSVPRARLVLDGGMTEYLSFQVRLGVLSDGSASFERAFADVHVGPVTLRAGIFYLPTSAGDNPGPGDLQALDYSQYALQSGGGAAAGAGVRSELGRVRMQGYVSNGVRTAFSEFGNAIAARVALTTRVEARLLSKDGFSRFDTETSFRGSDLALRLGGAFHYQLGREDGALPSGDLEQFTADVTLEGSGFNVIAAARLLRIHPGQGNTTHDPGWSLQAGAFVHERVELWARYEALLSDGKIHSFPMRPDGLRDDYQAVGTGINVYLMPRTNYAKVQADFLYVPKPIADTWASPNDNAGLLRTEIGAQWSLRAQLVLSY